MKTNNKIPIEYNKINDDVSVVQPRDFVAAALIFQAEMKYERSKWESTLRILNL